MENVNSFRIIELFGVGIKKGYNNLLDEVQAGESTKFETFDPNLINACN